MGKVDSIWKKLDGFTLMEVMVSLSILVLSLSVLLPLITQVIQEEATIHEEEKAFQLLNNRLNDWVVNVTAPNEITLEGVRYEFIEEDVQDIHKICIKWVGKNERSYEKCGLAKAFKQ